MTSNSKPTPHFDWTELEPARRAIGLTENGNNGFTVQDYVAQYKIPRGTADSQLRRLVQSGVLQASFKYIQTSVGRRRVKCFHLITTKVTAP